ncbi:MAG: hypothetical protein ABUT20_59930 [Bacteroidota bacterium]
MKNVFEVMKTRIKKMKMMFRKLHPYYWFDNFLDGFEVDLKEFKY